MIKEIRKFLGGVLTPSPKFKCPHLGYGVMDKDFNVWCSICQKQLFLSDYEQETGIEKNLRIEN